jgi:hypothetical protein
VKPTHPIDQACEAIRQHAKEKRLHSIEMSVYGDGRVVFIEYDARGYRSRIVRGDLLTDGPHQMPSAAFADLVNGSADGRSEEGR